MLKSTAKQRQDLGCLRRLLNMKDDIYYSILESYDVESSKDLSRYEINELINRLRDEARELGVFSPQKTFIKYKYNNLANRDKSMASPAQLRKIEAMWCDISRAKTNEAREKALKAYLKRIVGKEEMRFLTAVDVRKVIKALENTTK